MFSIFDRQWAFLTAQFRSATCPYCFERFRLTKTDFRCSALASACPRMTDDELKRAWDDATPMGRVLKPTGRLFQLHRTCPHCKTRSHIRLCPYCHQELPANFAETRNYVFSVVGARKAGKSHFVAAVIETFKHERGPKLDILIRPISSQAENRYESTMRGPLYRTKRILEPTRTAQQRRESALPLVFQAKVLRTGRFGGKKRIAAAFFLSFFDTPGEDLQSDERTNNLTRYIMNSDGITALIDPLEMESVLLKLPEHARGGAGSHDSPISILNNISRAIRRHAGIGDREQIKIPIAITVSKLDVVDDLIDSSSPLHQRAPNLDGFPHADADQASLDMRTLLMDWTSPHMVQSIEGDFATVKYFGVSALGESPQSDGTIPSINPRRVTSPVEWLLHVNGLIQAAGQR